MIKTMSLFRRIWLFLRLILRPFDEIEGELLRISLSTAWDVSGIIHGKPKRGIPARNETEIVLDRESWIDEDGDPVISDGCTIWINQCQDCGGELQVVRPGKVQCPRCG